jgi:threonyl-tRNA synthetase
MNLVRFLAWHVENFRAVPTEKGRSPIVEEASIVEEHNAILVFANFEKSDESRQEDVISKASAEISAIAGNLKVKTVILNPFAHLFGELSSPESAVSMLGKLEESLAARGFHVRRLAFGMFYELELKAKGHRFSRIARRIE